MTTRLDSLRAWLVPILDRLRPFWALAALAEAAFIFWSSSRTWDDDLPSLALDWGNFLHFPLYGSLAVWLHLARGGARPGGRPIGITVLGVAACGLLDEVHQAGVPGRDFSLFDVVTDGAGAIFFLGALAILLGNTVDRRKAWQSMALALAVGLVSSFVLPGILPEL